MRGTGRWGVFVLLLAAVGLFGCNSSPTGVVSSGTLAIGIQPGGVPAAWRLEGHGLIQNGSGDHRFTDLLPGLYTLTWLPTDGWINVGETTVTVQVLAGSTVEVAGSFVQDVPVQLSIATEPEGVTAGWALTRPDGTVLFGSGDQQVSLAHSGRITLRWSTVDGWWRPQPTGLHVIVTGDTTFTGIYQQKLPLRNGFVCLPGGSFVMGSPPGELGHQNDENQHRVTLSHRFWCLRQEVTERQLLEAALAATRQDGLKLVIRAEGSADHDHPVGVDTVTYTDYPGLTVILERTNNGPVSPIVSTATFWDNLDGRTDSLLVTTPRQVIVNPELEEGESPLVFIPGTVYLPIDVTWRVAAACCDWYSLGEGLPRAYDHATWSLTGDPYAVTGYRLPTEAEWEYACRAGTETAFYTGPITSQTVDDPNLARAAWYGSQATLRVGMLKEDNGFGIYDQLGNLWEWTGDWYGPYATEPVTDPAGPAAGDLKVTRGGFFASMAIDCRAANRRPYDPRFHDGIGIRPVRIYTESR